MDYNQLVAILTQMGVAPPDVCRSSLYLDYLKAAQRYFKTVLPTRISRDNYTFVKTAVLSANLLNELAITLDLYVGAAVQAMNEASEDRDWDYMELFRRMILNADYDQNLVAFRERYTVQTDALRLLYENFTGNIELACIRLYKDVAALNKFYNTLGGDKSTIESVMHIKSTGSDFHKGGKQVLIITLGVETLAVSIDDVIPVFFLRKMVYKPSDVEIDCLLSGNSAAVNAVFPRFMEKSLVEIYNAELAIYKGLHPLFTGEPVDTYGILPMVYQSKYNGDLPVPLRNSYGYLQYLDNDVSGTAVQINGYYPFGESDYLIFKTDDANKIKTTYYRKAGALSALACCVSIQDMHIENMRIKRYMPYLIDMEVSFNKAVTDIENTSLFASAMGNPAGGVNGLFLESQDTYWHINNKASKGRNLVIELKTKPAYYQNRLWIWKLNKNKTNVPVDIGQYQRGFEDGMIILRAAQEKDAFDNWLARCKNVVVRYLAFGTAVLKQNITAYYLTPENARKERTLDLILCGQLTQYAKQYRKPESPNYLALAAPQCLLDLGLVDVPIYYYRIGMLEILDSSGNLVPIPDEVMIFGNKYPEKVAFPVDIPFATFFGEVPSDMIVRDQLDVLGQGAVPYKKRYDDLLESINESYRMGELEISRTIPVNH
jgi:hypothetical protein